MKSYSNAYKQKAEILSNLNLIRIHGMTVSPKNISEVTPINTVSKKSSRSKTLSNGMPLFDVTNAQK